MKKLLLLIAFLTSIFTIKVNALVDATDKFYINDYANILSEDTDIF